MGSIQLGKDAIGSKETFNVHERGSYVHTDDEEPHLGIRTYMFLHMHDGQSINQRAPIDPFHLSPSVLYHTSNYSQLWQSTPLNKLELTNNPST